MKIELTSKITEKEKVRARLFKKLLKKWLDGINKNMPDILKIALKPKD